MNQIYLTMSSSEEYLNNRREIKMFVNLSQKICKKVSVSNVSQVSISCGIKYLCRCYHNDILIIMRIKSIITRNTLEILISRES